ncbi:GNAT family N-acetyltransferase [Geomicrobium sediminis]|uniref:RimJ/RimL family protein N-acetyltransferase n=1 Tax=Geomicrobium sediminis TaxID=1347788 RepID=A0ABS2P733_9BACL|nr:GNAT family protein [Geomicrobium sediminis]MBM7631200.1 RimJ/RimL family protein N-acetyltransferase [Geomicrobium sediminis]
MLYSERLHLRKFTVHDAEIYHAWRTDEQVMKTTSLSLDDFTFEETKQFVQEVLVGDSHSRTYMIVNTKSNTPIGVTSLIHIDTKNRNAEMIIDIGEKEYWGSGYGFEAVNVLLKYAFLEQNFHRISLNVFAFNERAIHLYERIGFQQEGRNREAVFRDGCYHDIIQMGLLQTEFIGKRADSDSVKSSESESAVQ